MSAAAPPLHLPPERVAATDGHVPSLDGLRALSILFVLVAHLVSERLAPGGFGVQVFFLISGLLIARLMFAEHKKTGAVSLPAFYLRRFLRLYPVTLVYALLVVGVFLAVGAPFLWGELWSVLLYFSNYFYLWFDAHHAGEPGLPFGIFWSLAVEEHFYLLFPFAFLLMRGRAERLGVLMAAVCLGGLALRIGGAALHPEWVTSRALYYRTEFRLDAIAWGVLFACLCELPAGRRVLGALGHPLAFALATLALAATFVLRDATFRETWRYSIQGAGLFVVFAAILLDARYRLIQQVLNTPVLTWIGRLSYSLYVWHLCTPALSRWALPHAGWAVQTGVQWVLSFAFAALSFYALEQPIARWRRRLNAVRTEDRRRSQPAVPSPAVGLEPSGAT